MSQGTSPGDPAVSFLQLRKLVGFIGVLLPVVLPLGYLAFFHSSGFPDSVSGYYYTGMRNVFVGALCVLGVFLVAYRAYGDKWDNWITNIAGAFAVCVAFFPTQPVGATPHQKNIGHLHFVFAALLFTMLAIMALRFTKTDQDDPGREKRLRNIFYRICAALIAGSMVAALISNLPALYQNTPSLFVFETIAIEAFGISWLVKGEVVRPLNDPKPAALTALTAEPPAHSGAVG